MLNPASTTPTNQHKTPRELRELLRNCGFKVRCQRGNQEVWEHPHQTGMQIVLMLTDLHAVHRRQRQQRPDRKAQ